ncbi:MAG: TetR/AcrR family transcriptional regulator [Clostridia bacterium]|nr:TetR/AcrR family transcriptional regulator [Clostridia bacterium]
MKKGDLKRAQILDAAEKLFFEKGYDRTSVQDILDALGMSKGGFYHYFDSKEAVLRAVSERRAEGRFDKLAAELYGGRRSSIDRLNLLLGMANLFETEDIRFAALMLRLCYVEGDASMRAHHRRILLDRLAPYMADVIGEGVRDGSFHARHPAEVGRLLLLLALDADEEACAMLAQEPENPDVMLHMLELLNAWREAAEDLTGAPFGSIRLFDAGRLVSAWQTGAALLNEGV